jgi:hypothetical protein
MTARAAILLAGGVLALAQASALAADRGAIAERAAKTGFDAAEETHLQAAAAGDASAVVALAEFYAAHGLWPETIAAVERLKTPDAAAEALLVEAHYRFARYRDVIAASEGKHALSAFRAMALTRISAYAEAAAAFAKAEPPKGLEADFHLAAAEAHVFAGEAARALKSLDVAAVAGLPKPETARFQFLRGRIHLAAGDMARARAQFERAARHKADDWSMRAAIALADDAEALDRLALNWRSETFDRDLAMREGALALAKSSYEQGFAAYARVVARFPDSDAALAAQGEIGARLGGLFRADLPIEESARLFFDYVAFAPPGREGDALIRQAADQLKALGLYADAASLLDHQVSKRLRGLERSRVAADLADLQLAAKTPDAALRTLRSTRIAGLDAETNARRRLLEATALARLGKYEAAASLLEKAATLAETAMRASVHWEAERWSAAAADYAAIFAATPANREAALRAATAFLLAGDRSGYRDFANGAGKPLAGTREGEVIKSMGDIDRDAFLSTFMDKYRALYKSKPAT